MPNLIKDRARIIRGARTRARGIVAAVNRRVRPRPDARAVLDASALASDCYGWDRGTPVDRHYIETYLERNADAIRGDVLEVRDGDYTRRFGGDRVAHIEVVDIDADNPEATIVADLTVPGALPEAAFDCIVLTQVLNIIGDDLPALRTLWTSLRPGGTLLVTVPMITRVDNRHPDADSWRYTPAGLRRRLEAAAPGADVVVEGAGNLRAAIAFLQGFAVQDVGAELFADNDPRFPVVVGARVTRPADGAAQAG